MNQHDNTFYCQEFSNEDFQKTIPFCHFKNIGKKMSLAYVLSELSYTTFSYTTIEGFKNFAHIPVINTTNLEVLKGEEGNIKPHLHVHINEFYLKVLNYLYTPEILRYFSRELPELGPEQRGVVFHLYFSLELYEAAKSVKNEKEFQYLLNHLRSEFITFLDLFIAKSNAPYLEKDFKPFIPELSFDKFTLDLSSIKDREIFRNDRLNTARLLWKLNYKTPFEPGFDSDFRKTIQYPRDLALLQSALSITLFSSKARNLYFLIDNKFCSATVAEYFKFISFLKNEKGMIFQSNKDNKYCLFNRLINSSKEKIVFERISEEEVLISAESLPIFLLYYFYNFLINLDDTQFRTADFVLFKLIEMSRHSIFFDENFLSVYVQSYLDEQSERRKGKTRMENATNFISTFMQFYAVDSYFHLNWDFPKKSNN